MVNPFDKKAVADRLAARNEVLAEPKVLKVGLKLAKDETPVEGKTLEAFLARHKNRK